MNTTSITRRASSYICQSCLRRSSGYPQLQLQQRHYASKKLKRSQPSKQSSLTTSRAPRSTSKPPDPSSRYAPQLPDYIVPDVPTSSIRTQPPGTIRIGGWIFFGTVFFGMCGWYGATAYRTLHAPPSDDEEDDAPIDLTQVYDETAGGFDAQVDSLEYWTGVMKMRRRLVRQARGDVLESAAGTGRNSEYYTKAKIRSLTLVDKSKEMLALAESKWPKDREGEDWTGVVRFIVGDIEQEEREGGHIRPEVNGKVVGKQFDTVVQTMGLCSTDDPDRLMRSLSALVKPGGKIVLLEHGQGFFDWLNTLLDRTAREHAKRHGCWWNRDIGDIVRRSGLEVLEVNRPWYPLGTNWHVVLRKPREVQGDEKKT